MFRIKLVNAFIALLGKVVTGGNDLEYLKNKKESEFKSKWNKVEKKRKEAETEFEDYRKALDYGLLEIDSNKDAVKEKAAVKIQAINLKKDIKVLELDTVRDVLVERKNKISNDR